MPARACLSLPDHILSTQDTTIPCSKGSSLLSGLAWPLLWVPCPDCGPCCWGGPSGCYFFAMWMELGHAGSTLTLNPANFGPGSALSFLHHQRSNKTPTFATSPLQNVLKNTGPNGEPEGRRVDSESPENRPLLLLEPGLDRFLRLH